MRIPSRPCIILVLLISAIAVIAFSIFFFIRLDQLVHGELYNYGLRFNYEWAGQYWADSRDFMIGLTIAMSLTSASIAFYLFCIPVRLQVIGPIKLAVCLVLIAGIVASVSSAYFFNRLDQVVSNDLYEYGLQLNYEWGVQYWIYVRLILALIELQITLITFSIVLISGDTGVREKQRFMRIHTSSKPSSKKVISSILLLAGLLALAFSIIYSSKILAFIGLGLVLWSIVLFYTVSQKKCIEGNLPDTKLLPSLTDVDKTVKELDQESEAAYLPRAYHKDVESGKVCINALRKL